MAVAHLPRSLAALFPDAPRRLEVPAHDVASLILELDARYPGMWDRLCEPGPRLRRHINAFVDGQPASLDSRVSADSVVHLIPAVSGGALEAERIHLESAEAWHAWLEEHHRRREGVWLVQWKPRTGKPAIPYEDAVREALCFGWIDSTYRSLDEERGMLWWSPRRKGSLWARTNKERIAQLEDTGRMTDAGRAAVERAKADGSWGILEPVEGLIVPDDLGAALAARPGAGERWAAMPPTAMRAYLLWIVTAKRSETRARRVHEAADLIQQGRRLEDR
jgi:uncharacterized protein YdeI (YjbR/CyaY-like superfamily)/molybdopterin converting factor small subunit